MSTRKLLCTPPKLQVYKLEREEDRALLRGNQPFAGPIFFPDAAVCIYVNSGASHSEMGRRDLILENRGPVSDIAEVLPESRIAYGFTEGRIDAFVSIGSALSNFFARSLDGHAETLERVRRAAFGSFLTEFDPTRKNVVSYIEGEKVREPWRIIVNEGNRKQAPIFEPELDKDGIPKYDALSVKVLRSRIGKPTILRIEGLGPAGTVYGFKLLLKDRNLLLELGKWASKWGSFEVVFLVKGVGVEEDLRGRKIMVAKGPLDIVGDCRPIQEVEGNVDIIRAATSAPLIPVRKNIFCFPTPRDVGVDLRVQEAYNRGDKNAVAAKPLPRDNDMERKKFVPTIDQIISDESKKVINKFKEQSSARGLSDEEGIEIFRQGMSGAREIFDARFVRGMTSEEVNQKIEGLAKKHGVVFESQPKPKEIVTPPDFSEIPLWEGRRKGGMPLEFIEKHYGKWLSAFGAEENGVFQDQIRAHDRKLMQGLRSQLHEEGGDRKVKDFVKSRSSRIDRELENISVEDLKKNPRLATALYWRGRRAAERRAVGVSKPSVTKK